MCETALVEYERLARELLRALRGKRSQTQLSRRLGYRSNVCHAWETGKRYPTAAETLRVAEKVGVELREVFRRFEHGEPAWLEGEPASPAAIAAFLRAQRGTTTVVELARTSGRSRFAVARWLEGTAQPRLPDFLRLVEASSRRLVELLELLCDVRALPAARRAWQRLDAHRRAASDVPFAEAILRSLEVAAAGSDADAQAATIGRWLRMSPVEVTRALTLLARIGAIGRRRGRWVTSDVTVDTRVVAGGAGHLKRVWARFVADRAAAGAEGRYSYNVFSCSAADLAEIEALHLAHYERIRAIIARSTPAERVAVMTMNLVPFDRPA